MTARYRQALRAQVRGLWTGVLSEGQFANGMFTAVDGGLTRAWNAGLKDVGILPGEQTPEELAEMFRLILAEVGRIPGLSAHVSRNSKANGGKLFPLFDRVELWVNRMLDIRNRAKVMAGANKKLQWRIDPAKDNCSTCLKLNNKVKRASAWEKSGIKPQNPPNPDLECEGWRCGCSWHVTDLPLSKGPLPRR